MFDLNLFGEPVEPEKHGTGLAATWDYPPFSVLSARDGWWQERKRQWLALGIQSELGRGENLSAMGGAIDPREAIKRGTLAAAFDNGHGLATWQRDKRT